MCGVLFTKRDSAHVLTRERERERERENERERKRERM